MTRPIEIQNTISRQSAESFYDWLGARYDWAEAFESRAKRIGLELLDMAPGQRILNAGSGTGKDHLKLLEAISPGGQAVGLDLSWEMINLTRMRTGSPCLQAIVESLPLQAQSFDRVFSSYVLDLIPGRDIGTVLAEFKRILRPGGILVNVSLSRGHSLTSRAVIAAWLKVYETAPVACGGCRPVALYHLAKEAGFSRVMWEIVEQFAVPSEIVLAIN